MSQPLRVLTGLLPAIRETGIKQSRGQSAKDGSPSLEPWELHGTLRRTESSYGKARISLRRAYCGEFFVIR